MDENKKSLSLVERLKLQAQGQKRAQLKIEKAQTLVLTCPNCGAGRTKRDGLTHCAYCGHSFTENQMSEGIHIKHSDNTQ